MHSEKTDNEALTRDFAQYLILKRREAGYSISQTAHYAGIHRATYSHYEHGYSSPTIPNLYRLFYVLNLEIDDFFTGTYVPPPLELCDHCRGTGHIRREP